MTAATKPLSLTVEHRYDATPARVFEAWLDPAKLARFMRPGPQMTVPEARTDPQVGGRFEIVMRGEGRDMPHAGTYLAIEPPERLVFTWESPFSTEGSTVTLTLRPDGAGTHLTLLHERFPDEDSRANHEAGWARILSELEGAA